jgi:hypothetical protein
MFYITYSTNAGNLDGIIVSIFFVYILGYKQIFIYLCYINLKERYMTKNNAPEITSPAAYREWLKASGIVLDRKRVEIKMPKSITTLEEYNTWVKSFANGSDIELEVTMKRRSEYPYAFSVMSNGDVHYLISDGYSTGRCKVSSFNRTFKFSIYNWDV